MQIDPKLAVLIENPMGLKIIAKILRSYGLYVITEEVLEDYTVPKYVTVGFEDGGV